jgi:hypothetical protein
MGGFGPELRGQLGSECRSQGAMVFLLAMSVKSVKPQDLQGTGRIGAGRGRGLEDVLVASHLLHACQCDEKALPGLTGYQKKVSNSECAQSFISTTLAKWEVGLQLHLCVKVFWPAPSGPLCQSSLVQAREW